MNDNELYKECHRLFSYDAETGILTRKIKASTATKKGDKCGCDSYGYLVVSIANKLYRVHRIVWLMCTGQLPKYIDHINCDPKDNRLSNLRECNSFENAQNQRKRVTNKVGLKGVCVIKGAVKKPYRAQITHEGKYIHLGVFDTPELAHQAYKEACLKLHGEFANVG
jgi:hypothetical protein